ncbi:Transcriptional activator of fatty acid utilization [Linnemannia zychae]|nr:Transcriptional activator of fatty acid utilization [Linnemannia zychae]
MTLDETSFSRYLGNSSGIDLLQKNQLLNNGYLMVPVKQREFEDWRQQTEAAAAELTSQMPLPPQDLADHLIDTYWDYVHPHLPILHKPLFMRQYKNADPEKRPPIVLLNAMFALSSRFSEHPEIVGMSDPEDFGIEYFSRAKQLVDLDIDMPRQASIQALLLLVLYRFVSSRFGGRGVWIMLGQATRMAQDLGMHRDSSRWHLPPLETEIRKRLWWVCYLMDRWVSASFGRPIAIDDSDCDVEYPVAIWEDLDENEIPPGENSEKIKEESSFFLQYFVEHIKLAKIIGMILRRIYSASTRTHGPAQISSTVAELDTMLTKWHLGLPQRLKYDHQATDLNRWVGIIHSSYYTALILLHRPYMIPTSLTRSNLTDSMPSLNICISAADSITHLAKRLDDSGDLKYLWAFASYELFSASLIHLTNSASMDMRLQIQSRKNLVTSIQVLKHGSNRWFNATRLSGFLEDLMCAHLNFNEYKAEGRTMQPIVVGSTLDENRIRLPVLKDAGHPSGGSLLVAPKETSTPHTPSSAVSTPSSSPSTPSTNVPLDSGNDNTNHAPGGGKNDLVVIPMQETTVNPSTNTHTPMISRPTKGRKPISNNSQKNSLHFSSSMSPSTPSSSNVGGTDHPPFIFSSLKVPGMFTQGQAFAGFGDAITTPLFSSPLALQQQVLNGSSLRKFPTQQSTQGSQPPHHPAIQQLQQQQQNKTGNIGFIQYQQQQQQQQTPDQGYLASSQGFISSISSASGYANTNEITEEGVSKQVDYPDFSLFPQQKDASIASTGAGSSASAPSAATLIAGCSNTPSLLQDPNVISAVPNPFFGVPNTIDWDEWQQYIANAGLQKL